MPNEWACIMVDIDSPAPAHADAAIDAVMGTPDDAMWRVVGDQAEPNGWRATAGHQKLNPSTEWFYLIFAERPSAEVIETIRSRVTQFGASHGVTVTGLRYVRMRAGAQVVSVSV